MATARIAVHEATRIRMDGQAITQIYGAGVLDAKTNPGGALIVQPLDNRGEASVIPVRGAGGTGDKPVSIFVDTAKATYTLVLIPAEIPSDTIVLHDRQAESRRNAAASVTKGSNGASSKRAANYYREIKRFVLTLEGSEESPDLNIKSVHEVVGLWPEAKFVQTERVSGDDTLRGERYLLTNISAKPMRIDERELYAPDIVAVAIEKADLAPKEATAVYIVREAGDVR